MKKKELLALPILRATRAMMKLAAEDTPVVTEYKDWWNGQVTHKSTYRFPLHLRSIERSGILKVAYFTVESMRLGGRLPIYELYLDRKHDDFLTYDRADGKWRTAKLDQLEWPTHVPYACKAKASPSDLKRIQRYFESSENDYDTILRFQKDVRQKELLARHKRETDPWDEELKQVPPLPRDWAHWVNKVGITEHFMYYHYKRGGTKTGYCSYCEREVPISKPRHNKVGRCPRCRHQVVFKALGKVGFLVTDEHFVYLPQKTACGFVIREFKAWRRQCRGEYRSPKTNYHEIRRCLYRADGTPISAYYWGTYKQCELRWIKGCLCSSSAYYYQQAGRVYGKTLPQLMRDGLSRTGLKEHLTMYPSTDPELYLAVYHKVPKLEQLIKAGLSGMAQECMHHAYDYSQVLPVDSPASLKKALGLSAAEFKRLRGRNGTLAYLRWLQLEHSIQSAIPDTVIDWMLERHIEPESIQFILGRMNVVQIYNYMRRQMSESCMDARTMLTTWQDYLNMAASFHYNVNDEIVYRAAKLKQRHDELVERSRDKSIAVRAGKLLQTFPHIDEICRSLAEKYNYVGKDYAILAPTCLRDILKEGDTLHHCIASSDRYVERIERQESYLLFLRRSEAPEQAYYTMEVEPNGTVRQIRTMYDRQNEDIDEAKQFLHEWQAVVAKRLTEDDRAKAARSRALREQEFLQLRRDQIRINHGDLSGQLLVEVLTADLLESAA